MFSQAADLTGRRFVRLVATHRAEKRKRHVTWRCVCDCGNEITAFATNLVKGNTKSCGCLKVTHGHIKGNVKSPTYQSWSNMISRCTNPSSPSFADYGGAGITVCDRWRSFQAFLEDMGERPNVGFSLDRFPDQSGNYEPGNCRWATAVEQANNCKNNRLYEYQGKSYSLADLAKMAGVKRSTMRQRLEKAQWPVAMAVETPIIARGYSLDRRPPS